MPAPNSYKNEHAQPPKRALIIAPEPLLPANHGARVDMWNRYCGLKNEGWDLQLAVWHESDAAPSDMAHVFKEVIGLPIKRDISARLRRWFLTAVQPSLVSLRSIDKQSLQKILDQVDAFSPSLIICEFVYCYELARKIAEHTGLPLFLRSHNIEYRYMSTQLSLAASVEQKMQILAALSQLKKYETGAVVSADHVLDISETDAAFWRSMGAKDVRWVPTFFPQLPASQPIQWENRLFDIGYLGNLWAPNNVSAINWFLEDILPIIRQAKPDVRVMIAGSKATQAFAAKIENTPNVTYVANPVNADAARADARVLINPIRAGSGINTKSVEMLFSDSALVVTEFAVAGMSSDAREAFKIADTAEEIASLVLDNLAVPFAADIARLKAREIFGPAAAKKLSELLLSLHESNDAPTRPDL